MAHTASFSMSTTDAPEPTFKQLVCHLSDHYEKSRQEIEELMLDNMSLRMQLHRFLEGDSEVNLDERVHSRLCEAPATDPEAPQPRETSRPREVQIQHGSISSDAPVPCISEPDAATSPANGENDDGRIEMLSVCGRKATIRSSTIFPELLKEWKKEDSDTSVEQTHLYGYAVMRSGNLLTYNDIKKSGELIIDKNSYLQVFVIRPNSMKRLMWDVLSMMMLFYDILYFPVNFAFDLQATAALILMDWSVALFWSLDISLNFFTGFHSKGLVEMRSCHIAIRYIRTWLIPDVCIVMTDWIVVFVLLQAQQEMSLAGLARVAKTTRTLRILKVLKFFRIVRLAKINHVMASIFVYIKSETLRTSCNIALLLVILIVVVNHYVGCGWYFIGTTSQNQVNWLEFFRINQNSTTYAYTTSLHWSLTQFTPAGMEIYARNQVERIYSVCILLFAMVTFSSFVSSITSAMTHLRSLRTEPDKQKRMLRTYFSENDISAELNQRIWTYLQNSHWSMKKRVHERDIPILKTLPETPKAKFREELFFPTLERAPFLRKFSILHRSAIGAVCFRAVSETSLICTEELFTPGVVADKMYFIAMGIMEYQHMSLLREEDHELKEKQWVGEPVLWMKWTHFGTLLARTACEIIGLDAVEFRKVALASDASAAFFSEYARLFVDHLVKSDHWATDVWMNEDDLEELVRRACGEEEQVLQSPSMRSTSDNSVWSMSSARSSVASWIGRKTRSLTEVARRGTS